MSESRKQFTFYSSFYEAVSKIKKKADRADAYDAICAYAINGDYTLWHALPLKTQAVLTELLPLLDLDRRDAAEGRRSAEYKAWRKSVFERDDYTCRFCGARGVKINAHHIKPYAFCPEARYELSNGITLCLPCHKAVHKRRK